MDEFSLDPPEEQALARMEFANDIKKILLTAIKIPQLEYFCNTPKRNAGKWPRYQQSLLLAKGFSEEMLQ